ncbi:TfuA-like protein [Streptantibioticus silvisoli]|uniref:TfuA-like protein n=1 Tax=Streptantibioticus silvisoli TaxID=2705255 RepID=A0ABT6W7C4_9ACTN|nr:TfuA-like protein [Streptantibioticus silvisoli]MDI5966644.1 TfuA-like protein [Streptantibioticus silvisoli]
MTDSSTLAGTADEAATTGIVLFTGPSLRPEDLTALSALAATAGRELRLEAPVRRHDLLDLAESAPHHHIVMLDGEFGQRLSVSITEVRAVLAAGQSLAGASSMGALRAVECRTLGMTGSGWVFEQYLSGAIESDGDVALLYDPQDYLPVTVPLVNVRWLLAEKQRQGLLTADVGATALRTAHAVHFRDRRPSLLLRQWRRELPTAAVEVLEPELAPERRDSWDRKRLDGIEAVRSALGLDT